MPKISCHRDKLAQSLAIEYHDVTNDFLVYWVEPRTHVQLGIEFVIGWAPIDEPSQALKMSGTRYDHDHSCQMAPSGGRASAAIPA
jgi:hypothetical protein